MKIAIFTILIVLAILGLRFYFRNFFPLRPKEKGFEFVYVKDDGTVRELYQEEKEYLSENFLPNDGNRPYVKYRYSELTPSGKISGYIRRVRVPKNIRINAA